MAISEIFLLMLMGAASILCIFMVFYLGKITRSVTGIEKTMTDLSSQLGPVITNLTETTNRLNILADDLNKPVSDIIQLIEKIEGQVQSFLSFELKVRNNFAAAFNGFLSGFKTFWHTYRGNGKHRVSKAASEER